MELDTYAFYVALWMVAILLDIGIVLAWRRLQRRRQVRAGEIGEGPVSGTDGMSARQRRVWTIVELVILAVCALWVGRAYLNFDPLVVPGGNSYSSASNEFGSAVQTHHIWTWVKQCGLCALWNGAERGGYPSFADVYGSALHPLVIIATLIWGVVNGAKITLVVALWIGGVAQWWLARVMKLGWLARLWSGLMGVAGAHLAGRMELGAFGVVLSTAVCSLVFASALSVAQSNSRRSTVILAALLASSVVAGQGYIQIGLLFTAPAFLLLLLNRRMRLRPVWREYAIAAGLALLLCASFLIPMVHFLPSFVKTVSDDFGSAQPLEYLVLNLVIRDPEFVNTDALSKSPYPHLTAMYIGWVPIALAVLCLRFGRRSDRRALLFLGASVVLELLTASAVLLRWTRLLIPAVAAVRHPTQIAGLAVSPILGLSAYGLDKLFKANWPRLRLDSGDGPASYRKIGISLKWLVLVPLMWNLWTAYSFSRNWLHVTGVGRDVYMVLQALRTPSLQWVEPPSGEHTYIEPAIRMGLKLSPGIMPWRWRDRSLPEPYLEASQQEPPPGSLVVDTVGDVLIYRFEGYRDYAFVQAGSEVIPCQASGTGGDLIVRCSVNEDGTLLVRENRWTGWYAWRDQKRVPLLEGRWLSVDAPMGEHWYRFRYLPWDVPFGVLLSLLGIGLGIWQWFKHPTL